ncbi:protein zyg-11 homolog B-like [Artemia franciscana]|uniref:Uncharacterized protein n=1 Tax=Artemia franciscana TaxID=6661 RepID=A0AA88I5B4_ARTSF|nr:hypothetical protein QYM36_003323 [Artemia franciscana]
MHDSPSHLHETCLDFICENIEAVVCESGGKVDEISDQLSLKDSSVYIPSGLSEQLISVLSEKGKLNDNTVSVFSSENTSLKHVNITNGQGLTKKGLRVFKGHNIVELTTVGLSAPVCDLMSSLNEWTKHNLVSLNISACPFRNPNSPIVNVLEICRLKNLRVLDISRTELNDHNLAMICEDLPNLEVLDISQTEVNDISVLRLLKERLRSLTMYDLRSVSADNLISVLSDLRKLQHLDISVDKERDRTVPFRVMTGNQLRLEKFLKHPDMLPLLLSLDISGKEEEVESGDLRRFLGQHTKLRFLGLAHTDVCYDEIFIDYRNPDHRPDLIVTGSATEQQVLEALKRYLIRPSYVQRALYDVFRLTQSFNEPRVDVLKLVLRGMSLHPSKVSIQMAATACLYNLSKGELGQKVHPHVLQDVVSNTLSAMETYPKHQQLQKNTLLTLCSDRILQDVSFDRFRCAKLVLDSLCQFDDPSMGRMSVAICSILAAKISTEETSRLGAQPQYMKKLLQIVKSKTDSEVADITLKFTLSALWNLTDESPITCEKFLQHNGMAQFLTVLETFKHEASVETKVLGLMNNIAEVPELRQNLMVDDFLVVLKRLLHSTQIDVSYFAAGIISHLGSSGTEAWVAESVSRSALLDELGEEVMRWEAPEGEMVAYRSFKPFFPLLACDGDYQVQLWSVWAIHHVCTKNAKRYCPMLVAENGVPILKQLATRPSTHFLVKSRCDEILELLRLSNITSRYA